jgi:hypothetical protein
MKINKAAIATAIAVFAAATYASPYVQLYRMRAAVEARDTRALVKFIDFPALRGSVTALVTDRLGLGPMFDDASSNALARFGQSMAMAVIEPVVAVVVTPEGVRTMLETGDIELQLARQPDRPAGHDLPHEKIRYTLSYRSLNQVTVENKQGVGARFILNRNGLWGWKLAGVEAPPK